MKLRNKKTGEIGRLYFDHQLIDPKTGTYAIVIQHRDKLGYEAFANYFTLAELNEEWEDCKPKEPLIKDEKIRKAVRAWAEANGFTKLMFAKWAHNHWIVRADEGGHDFDIDFFDNGCKELPDYEYERFYTITELCGEEKECSD